MKGYVSRTSNELEKMILTYLTNGLNERIDFLGEELMDLEEEEFDFRVKNALEKEGFNCLEKEYSYNEALDVITTKKSRVFEELNEAKEKYKHIKKMLQETYC